MRIASQSPSGQLHAPRNSDNRAHVEVRQVRDHYDRYPYDVGVRGSQAYTVPKSDLGRFILEIDEGNVLDIGCGPGNLLPLLAQRARHAVGIDISHRSLQHAAAAVDSLPVSLVQGNALQLPFEDESFDFVIATGSLHCTSDTATGFAELCRVLRCGGRGFVTLYHRGSYYYYLYHTLGSLARAFESHIATRFIFNRCFILPLFMLYFFVGRLLVHRRFAIPSYRHVLNYFADQFLHPVVKFYSLSDLQEWAASANAELVSASTTHARALLNVTVRRIHAQSE